MTSFFGGKSLLRLATALTLIAIMPVCLAESGAGIGASTNPDKHTRKIHRELSRFQAGSYIHLDFRDGSERTALLDSLDESSFTVTNAENNARETHAYADIQRVTREKNYIGEGSEGHVRHIRLWVPITIGVLAAGAAVTAVEVR